MRHRATTLVWLGAVAMACQDESFRIEAFRADPTEVAAGSSVRLRWVVEGAQSVQIRFGPASAGSDPDGDTERVETDLPDRGTWDSPPLRQGTRFQLEAIDGATVRRRTIFVPVREGRPPLISRLEVDPAEVSEGAKATVRWAVERAARVELTVEGETVPLYDGPLATGETEFVPSRSSALLLRAYNSVAIDERMAAVQVVPERGPQFVEARAVPDRIARGDATELDWRVQGAESVEIRSREVLVAADLPPQGRWTVAPTETTSYTLTASNGRQTSQSVVVVTVDPGPAQIVSFASRARRIGQGREVQLDWSIQDAQELVLLEGDAELVRIQQPDERGSYVAPQFARRADYRLRVTGQGAEDEAGLVVFADPPPVIEGFASSSFVVAPSSTISVSWRVRNVESLDLLEDERPVRAFEAIFRPQALTDEAGSLDVRVDDDRTLVLRASNGWGTVSATVAISAWSGVVDPGGSEFFTELAADVVKWFAVDVLEGQHLRVDTASTLPGLLPDCTEDYRLVLVDPSGRTVAVDEDSGRNRCPRLHPDTHPEVFALAEGRYFVGVSVPSSQAFPIGIRIEPLDPGCGNGVTDGAETCDAGSGRIGFGYPDGLGPVPRPWGPSDWGMVADPSGCVACSYTGPVEDEARGNDAPFAAGVPVLVGPSDVLRGTMPAGDVDFVAVDVPPLHSLRVRASVHSFTVCRDEPRLVLDVLESDGQTVRASIDSEDLPDSVGFLPGSIGSDDGCLGLGPADAVYEARVREVFRGAQDPQVTSALLELPSGRYFVRMRGQDAAGRPQSIDTYFLRVEVEPPACGNFLLEPLSGEQCDGGLRQSGFRCASDCTIGFDVDVQLPTSSTVAFAQIESVLRLRTDESLYLRVQSAAPDLASGCAGSSGFRLFDHQLAFVAGSPSVGCGALAPTRLTPGVYYGLARGFSFGPSGFVEGAELRLETLPVDVCGQGVRDPTEGCDDGNLRAGDGCGPTCGLEFSVAPITASATVTVQPPAGGFAPIPLQIGPAGAQLRVRTRGGCAGGFVVLQLFGPSGGRLGEVAGVGCASIEPSVSFARDLPPGAYHLRVFELDGVQAPTDVVVDIVPPRCGDGLLSTGANEDCDDGNQTGADGCPADCRFPIPSELEPNDDRASASPSGLTGAGKVTVKGRLLPDRDLDRWSFTVPAGTEPLFSAETYTAFRDRRTCFVDTVIELTDADGNRLAIDDFSGAEFCSRIRRVPLSPGSYQLSVRPFACDGVDPCFEPLRFPSYLLDLELEAGP
jgi:cysteine-rich repeat protein